MANKVDDKYLNALLGSAGKSIASAPGAKEVVAKMRLVRSPADFAALLQNVDLGLDGAARQAIWEAAADKERWRETHAMLVRSAEQQLTDRFHASS